MVRLPVRQCDVGLPAAAPAVPAARWPSGPVPGAVATGTPVPGTAAAGSWARESMRSLPKARARWPSTVFWVMYRRWAISRLAWPAAVSPAMFSPRPRETMTTMPVGREHITGRRAPVTSTAHRPSDWDEDEI